MLELNEYYRELRSRVPNARLYYVKVPPSVDGEINANIQRYNRTMCLMLGNLAVTIVPVLAHLYAEDGRLKPEYARQRELQVGYAGQKLHLSDEAQNKQGYVIQRVICKTAKQRMR